MKIIFCAWSPAVLRTVFPSLCLLSLRVVAIFIHLHDFYSKEASTLGSEITTLLFWLQDSSKLVFILPVLFHT